MEFEWTPETSKQPTLLGRTNNVKNAHAHSWKISPKNNLRSVSSQLNTSSPRTIPVQDGPSSSPASSPSTASTSSSPSPQSKPSFPGISLPLITIGWIHSPIPPGRLSKYPLGFETLHLGIDKMFDAIDNIDDPDVYIKLLTVTDPFSAANLSQTYEVDGKKVLFVEKGAAEALARGRMHLKSLSRTAPDPGQTKHGKKGWNLFDWIGSVANNIKKDAHVRENIKKEATALASTHPPKQQKKEEIYQLVKPKENTLDILTQKSKQFQNISAHLANISVRLALSLLKNIPGDFVLVGGNSNGKTTSIPLPLPANTIATTNSDDGNLPLPIITTQEIQKQKNKKKKPKKKQESIPSFFSGASTFDTITVYFLSGLQILQSRNSTTLPIEYTPVFLSQTAMQSFVDKLTAFIGGAFLASRQMERRILTLRLQQAAAIVSGTRNAHAVPGGPRGTGTTTSILPREDSDDEGIEEPPEIQEVIQEMTGIHLNGGVDMFGDDRSMPGSGMTPGSGGVGGASKNAFVRTAATMVCGLITLIAPSIESIGNAIDNLIFSLPYGAHLLGIPTDIAIESKPLRDMLIEMHEHNTRQALGVLEGVIDVAKAQGGSAETGMEEESESSSPSLSACDGRIDDTTMQKCDTTTTTTNDDDNASINSVDNNNNNNKSIEKYQHDMTVKTLWMGITAKIFADAMRLGSTDPLHSSSISDSSNSVLTRVLKTMRILQTGVPPPVDSSLSLPPFFPQNSFYSFVSALDRFGMYSPLAIPEGANVEDPRFFVIALLRHYLPLLEFNEFRRYFPAPDGVRGRMGAAPVTEEEMKAAEMMGSNRDEVMNVQLRFELEKDRSHSGHSIKDKGGELSKAENEGREEEMSSTLFVPAAKGMIVIGDVENATKERSVYPNGFSSLGSGGGMMPIAVLDGTKYI